jgi:glycosyltransferase involved in cell wall biosynthesis
LVAIAVGGIKEVVVDGETGILVPLEQQKEAPFEPVDPDQFSRDLATGVNKLVADKNLRESMAQKGRKRVETTFDWVAIAEETKALYKKLIR